MFKNIYPEFERVVCYNNVSVPSVDADVYEQLESHVCFPIRLHDNNPEEASGCGWKLCPPRLDNNAHELWLDNDVVILRRLPQIDNWLLGDCGIISEGLHRRRMYGEFDGFIAPGIHVCAGLFGLPPGFDFQERIAYYSQFATKPIGGYDEQGLTSSIVTNMDSWILVPLSQLYISEDHVSFPDTTPPAIHFVAANRKNWHRGWKSYQRRTII